MRYYKGDIVQFSRGNTNDPFNHEYASELLGINETIDAFQYVLWYRPLKNRVKQLFHYINRKLS